MITNPDPGDDNEPSDGWPIAEFYLGMLVGFIVCSLFFISIIH